MNEKLYKPIKYFGVFFLAIGILGFACLLLEINNENFTLIALFVVPISSIHILIGLGLITKNINLFKLFLVYIKIMLIAFPIGTYIARATLRYIDDNNIEKYFQSQ